MIHTLTSSDLRVSVSNEGAELQSIFSNITNTEYLWQGDPAWWGSRAPILFPIIGGLKDGGYVHKGRGYSLPKHGFVRRAYFHGKHEMGKLVFEYMDNPQTRTVFPFEFLFTVTFSLDGNVLHVENRVENRGRGDMFFSVGAHEAYRCPVGEDEKFEDYYIAFEFAEGLDSYIVNGKTGLLTGESYPVTLENGRELSLKHDLFNNDALIFKSIKSKKVMIKSRKTETCIEVGYDAPHLGIWTKPGAPYVCIEPWCGLPDYDSASGVFSEKEGNMRLEEGGVFVFKHWVRVGVQ